MTPLAVSVPEAARLLGLSRSTTYTAVQRGDIPSVRIGGRILVPMRKLEELVDPEAVGGPDSEGRHPEVVSFTTDAMVISTRTNAPAGEPGRPSVSPCEEEGPSRAP